MNDIDISNQYKEAKYNGTSSINRVKTGRLQSRQSNNITGDRTWSHNNRFKFDWRDVRAVISLLYVTWTCLCALTSHCNQGFWIYLYFRIRHSFAHLRPVILSADWSISRLQNWTCSTLSTVDELVKLTQGIVIEIQRQSADLYKVQLCNRQIFVVSTAIYVVKVYECHPLAATIWSKGSLSIIR